LAGGGDGKNSALTPATGGPVLEPGQVNGGPCHVTHVGSRRLDDALEVDEDLSGLGGGIVATDEVAVLVQCNLTGDEQGSARHDDAV